MYNLIETTKAKGLEPLAHLNHLFAQLAGVKTQPAVNALLPHYPNIDQNNRANTKAHWIIRYDLVSHSNRVVEVIGVFLINLFQVILYLWLRSSDPHGKSRYAGTKKQRIGLPWVE